MTKRDALAEARRRCGLNGYVHSYGVDTKAVGVMTYSANVGTGLEIKGHGDTWELAFADADRWEKEVSA